MKKTKKPWAKPHIKEEISIEAVLKENFKDKLAKSS